MQKLLPVCSMVSASVNNAWFVANQKFPNGLELSYTNFPDKFVWNKTDREWKERVKGHGTMIARVYSAHPGGDHVSI